MNQKVILETVKKVREISKKRNFSQSFDLCITLKNLNPKSQDDKVDTYFQLPFEKSKKPKICALVGQELETKAKIFDKVIPQSEFSFYSKNKKEIKKLASTYDFFIAQANLMSDIATHFGKVLGPKGKMPNPKAGCVVPLVIQDLKPIKNKLEKTIRFVTKDQLIVKAGIANEQMKDEEITENILTSINNLIHALPKEKENIKQIFIKLTMGPAVEITEKGPIIKNETKTSEKT